VFIAGFPPDSATARAIRGEAARWGLTEQLLASVFDALAVISWQLSGDKQAPRPKPMPRPGVADPTIRHGRTNRPRGEVVAYLRRYGPPKEVNDG